jgi:hypothetical protein
MTFAPGVDFIEDKHEYWYKGRQLSGITGLISKKLGLKMPQEFVEEHQMEGIHVHKAVQKWIETGDPDSVHPGVKWLTETFAYHTLSDPMYGTYSEVLVTDFMKYASAVDIISDSVKGFQIYDIKKGSLNRQYVTYQLNIYRYFIERYARKKISDMVCISVRDKEYYDIFRIEDIKIERLLYK